MSAHAAEHARPILLDSSKSTLLPDIAAGAKASYRFEFLVRSQLEGIAQLAQFQLHYDLPGSGVVRAETFTAASIEITQDHNRMVRDPYVTKVERSISVTHAMEAAQEDIANPKKDRRETALLLKRLTGILTDQGEVQKAEQVEELHKIVSEADDSERDMLVKRVRGTTGMLSQPTSE